MEKVYKNERVKNLEEITKRHTSREIEGCTSWRHFAVHEDRAWLLRAMDKIQQQVEQVRLSANKPDEKQAVESEVHKLLAMFDEATLNHLGD